MIEELEKKKANTRAEVLEMVGDIPDAEIRPPDNVLFICRLNPYTTEESLRLIFSQFGKIKSCEIIKDRLTSDSLCYGFIEYENNENCVQAYFKMNNVLIDDRRIHVDFSQSVARVNWEHFGGWKKFFQQRARKKNMKRSSGKSSKQKNEDLFELKKRIGFRDEDRPDSGKYSLVYDNESSTREKRRRSRSRSNSRNRSKRRRERDERRRYRDKSRDKSRDRHRDRRSRERDERRRY